MAPRARVPFERNMLRLERIVARLPEAERVDVEAWGDHPTFRVRGKIFVFADADAQQLSVKLSHEEAAAVVATDPTTRREGYGLGRHGWVTVRVDPAADDERWKQITEWVRTSYTLIAPKSLVRVVLEEDLERKGVVEGSVVSKLLDPSDPRSIGRSKRGC